MCVIWCEVQFENLWRKFVELKDQYESRFWNLSVNGSIYGWKTYYEYLQKQIGSNVSDEFHNIFQGQAGVVK